MSDEKCFFCNNAANPQTLPNYDSVKYNCKYCGEYILDTMYGDDFKAGEDKFKIACVLNERRLRGAKGIAFDDKTDLENEVLGLPRISAEDILNEFPQKASEFLNRTLLNLSRLVAKPFDPIDIDIMKPDRYHFFASNVPECRTFLQELDRQELIRMSSQIRAGRGSFFLTAKCHEIVEALEHAVIDSKQAFIAMWFDASMDSYYDDGIAPAIKDAGYSPLKINMKEYNGDVCDEIIADINRSKFIVSDFTGERGGVYFEAGYAMGKGKEVIFTVHEDKIKDLHFDTEHYNHITYKTPEELYKKLLNRIRATIV